MYYYWRKITSNLIVIENMFYLSYSIMFENNKSLFNNKIDAKIIIFVCIYCLIEIDWGKIIIYEVVIKMIKSQGIILHWYWQVYIVLVVNIYDSWTLVLIFLIGFLRQGDLRGNIELITVRHLFFQVFNMARVY